MRERTLPTARQPVARVLVIPHCWDCGNSLAMLLNLVGCCAEVVRGGDAAVRRAREVLPQAVLLDIHIPEDNPREVLQRLRDLLGNDVRLIGVVAGEWEGEPPGWVKAEFDAWLHKPVEVDRLLDVVGVRRARNRVKNGPA
jgi:DNA-binding response OmpR family regulator